MVLLLQMVSTGATKETSIKKGTGRYIRSQSLLQLKSFFIQQPELVFDHQALQVDS